MLPTPHPPTPLLGRLECLKDYFHSTIAIASYIKLGLPSFSPLSVGLTLLPSLQLLAKSYSLAPEQIKTLGICNLALTIPARLIIGMLLDRFGPRITYSMLLMFAAVPCLATALSQDFNQLVISRLLMGIVGSGFVVGIRMVAEWFPPKEMGIAQGIYGGWGNFGAFGAEFALPILAVAASFLAGGASNWRFAIALTGIIAAIYGVIYYNSVQDTPTGKVYKKPKKNGALEVTSIKSFWAMIISNFGLIFALGLLAWRLEQKNIHFLDFEPNVSSLVSINRIICLPNLPSLSSQSRTTNWQENLRSCTTLSIWSSSFTRIHLHH